MTDETIDALFELPIKPFFSCDEDGFAIVDGALMETAASLLTVTPVLKLLVGTDNIFEQRPRKVSEHEGTDVTVECDGGVTVYLDFKALSAKVSTPDGAFFYKGGIEEGNDHRGFMSAR